MREPLFIKKNKDKWEQYDKLPTNNPDVLSERFTHILDDLAYAQTFYPKGKTVQYLNERAVNFYNQIYKKKKEPLSKLLDFWRYDLPLVIRKNHKLLLIALALFLFASFLGTLSAIYQPDFFDAIAPGYLDMTRDNIANGNPFGRYDENNSTATFFYIATHNITLAFLLDFVGGLFFCLGSIYSTFTNGLMFGGFHYMFYEADLGWEFGLVVMIHGTFELFALVLAVAAGFRLFHSLIITGTYTRVESIKKGFGEGMQLMILVFILLLVAGFLESYITRLSALSVATDVTGNYIPIWASLLILAVCSITLIWYFWILPIRVEKKFKNKMQVITAAHNIGKVIMA